jgi:signal transduction histidine kinase
VSSTCCQTRPNLQTILDLVAERGRALVSARTLAIELKEADEMVVVATAGELRVDAERSAADAALVVPLVWQDRSYGALVAMDCQRDGPEFSVEDEKLLGAFADGAAAALAAAGSLDIVRRRERLAASEAERARWARELHEAISGIEIETEKVHSLIAELRPRILDELGVGAAVETLADQTESPTLEVRTRIELGFEKGRIAIRYDEELETAVYRIVQEALGNAIQHANPSYVVIEVIEGDECGDVRIVVRDDGKGFDPLTPCGGFGLSGMRERVELFGGTLEIDSSPGEGTEVRAMIPAARQQPGIGPTQEV